MPVFSLTANLCYIVNAQNEVLLQFKQKGFGQGKWNGPGGKKKPGESILQSVKREVKEETGLEVENLKKIAELEFVFDGKEEWNQLVHVYKTNDFRGELAPSEEGELKWFKLADMPYDLMWEDDVYWLKDALVGKYARRRFYFDEQAKLKNHQVI